MEDNKKSLTNNYKYHALKVMLEYIVRFVFIPTILLCVFAVIILIFSPVFLVYMELFFGVFGDIKFIFAKELMLISFLCLFGLFITVPILKYCMRVHPIFLGSTKSPIDQKSKNTLLFCFCILVVFCSFFLTQGFNIHGLTISLLLVIIFIVFRRRIINKKVTGALFLRRFGGLPDRVFIPRIKKSLPNSVRLNMLVEAKVRMKYFDFGNIIFSGYRIISPLSSVTIYYQGEDSEWVENARYLISNSTYIVIDLSDLSDSILTELELLKEANSLHKVYWLTVSSKDDCKIFLQHRGIETTNDKIFSYSKNNFSFSFKKLLFTWSMVLVGLGYFIVICGYLIMYLGYAEYFKEVTSDWDSRLLGPIFWLICLLISLKVIGLKHLKKDASERLIRSLSAVFRNPFSSNR